MSEEEEEFEEEGEEGEEGEEEEEEEEREFGEERDLFELTGYGDDELEPEEAIRVRFEAVFDRGPTDEEVAKLLAAYREVGIVDPREVLVEDGDAFTEAIGGVQIEGPEGTRVIEIADGRDLFELVGVAEGDITAEEALRRRFNDVIGRPPTIIEMANMMRAYMESGIVDPREILREDGDDLPFEEVGEGIQIEGPEGARLIEVDPAILDFSGYRIGLFGGTKPGDVVGDDVDSIRNEIKGVLEGRSRLGIPQIRALMEFLIDSAQSNFSIIAQSKAASWFGDVRFRSLIENAEKTYRNTVNIYDAIDEGLERKLISEDEAIAALRDIMRTLNTTLETATTRLIRTRRLGEPFRRIKANGSIAGRPQPYDFVNISQVDAPPAIDRAAAFRTPAPPSARNLFGADSAGVASSALPDPRSLYVRIVDSKVIRPEDKGFIRMPDGKYINIAADPTRATQRIAGLYVDPIYPRVIKPVGIAGPDTYDIGADPRSLTARLTKGAKFPPIDVAPEEGEATRPEEIVLEARAEMQRRMGVLEKKIERAAQKISDADRGKRSISAASRRATVNWLNKYRRERDRLQFYLSQT